MMLSIKHYYKRWTWNLIFLFLASLILLSLARLGFTLYFGDYSLISSHPQKVLEAFWLGLRFDLMPLAYIFILPFFILNLALFFSGQRFFKFVRSSILFFLFFGFLTLFFIYVCDYAFYSFFQDHLNILFYGLIEDDTTALLISIWKNYNVVLWSISFIFFFFVFYKVLIFLFSPFDFDLKFQFPYWKKLSFFLSEVIVLIFFARGNFTRLPLSIEDAHISNVEFINKISINGPLSLNRAIKIRQTFGNDKFDYLKKFKINSISEAWGSVFGKKLEFLNNSLTPALKFKTSQNSFLNKKPPHVILIIMESFGSYWISKDGENFNLLGELKNHFSEAYIFNNFLPSENGTIGSVVSIATSQVIRPGARFLSESDFMKTSLESSGHKVYQKKGYETHFVYGGKLGWRDLGKYLRNQGYDNLWGADEIKDVFPELSNLSQSELGNEWGIFDEYLYSFVEERIKISSRPQFFLILTTTNHPPFEYPPSYRPLKLNIDQSVRDLLSIDEELARKRFLGLQYANQKVGEFLTRLKNSNFSENTFVALTGDHSFWIAKGVDSGQEFQRFAVPFYIFPPKNYPRRSYDSKIFGSHEDIFPTLFHLTLSEAEYIGLGENLFEDPGVALNSSGLVANKLGAFHHNKFWQWKDDTYQKLLPTAETEGLAKLKKYRDSLISLTDLYLKEEKKSKKTDVKNDQQ